MNTQPAQPIQTMPSSRTPAEPACIRSRTFEFWTVMVHDVGVFLHFVRSPFPCGPWGRREVPAPSGRSCRS
jgi:hypothetical protein